MGRLLTFLVESLAMFLSMLPCLGLEAPKTCNADNALAQSPNGIPGDSNASQATSQATFPVTTPAKLNVSQQGQLRSQSLKAQHLPAKLPRFLIN